MNVMKNLREVARSFHYVRLLLEGATMRQEPHQTPNPNPLVLNLGLPLEASRNMRNACHCLQAFRFTVFCWASMLLTSLSGDKA